MQEFSPTGSVSDRHGWEWNRMRGDGEDADHPPTFRPDRYDSTRNPQRRIEQLEREIEELRTELQRREQQREALIRQYELCLAEKDRQLDQRAGRADRGDLLDAIVSQLGE